MPTLLLLLSASLSDGLGVADVTGVTGTETGTEDETLETLIGLLPVVTDDVAAAQPNAL